MNYRRYKPFRNLVRTFGLSDSLYVLWAYSRFLSNGKKFPKDIEVAPQYLNDTIRERLFSKFDIETISMEILLNCDDIGHKKRNLKTWSNLANVRNALKDFESYIFTQQSQSQNHIYYELFRIAHRQFPWQIDGPNSDYFSRYLWMYDHPELDAIIKAKTGLSYHKILMIGLSVMAHFESSPILNSSDIDQAAEIGTPDERRLFFAFTGETAMSIQTQLKTTHVTDNTYAYQLSPLRRSPLIGINRADQLFYCCPIPTLLFWKITSGVYYNICREKG